MAATIQPHGVTVEAGGGGVVTVVDDVTVVVDA